MEKLNLQDKGNANQWPKQLNQVYYRMECGWYPTRYRQAKKRVISAKRKQTEGEKYRDPTKRISINSTHLKYIYTVETYNYILY